METFLFADSWNVWWIGRNIFVFVLFLVCDFFFCFFFSNRLKSLNFLLCFDQRFGKWISYWTIKMWPKVLSWWLKESGTFNRLFKHFSTLILKFLEIDIDLQIISLIWKCHAVITVFLLIRFWNFFTLSITFLFVCLLVMSEMIFLWERYLNIVWVIWNSAQLMELGLRSLPALTSNNHLIIIISNPIIIYDNRIISPFIRNEL